MESDEFELILETVRAFVRNEVVPAEDEIENTDRIPDWIRNQAKAMGLFGYMIPLEYGGLGMTEYEDARMAIEFGWTTPTFRSMFGTNNGIAGQVLVNAGTELQKERWLPGLANGEHVASFALTEPDAGSDPSGLRTKAVRDGAQYVINGQKRFITNVDYADLLMVFARMGDVSDGTKGISVFVVPTETPGITIGPKDVKMGQRGSATSEIFFDDVRVPGENLVGEVEGEGFPTAMRSLAKGRIHIAGMSVGMAKRLIHESLKHATSNSQGGTKLAEFQLVQAMIADSEAEAFAGECMLLEAARRYDAGQDTRIVSSSAKLYCTEMVGRVADRAVQIHGGTGYMRGVPVERFYRDARLFRLYEGTSEIQKIIIAKQLIKNFEPQ
jgi:acyl-CoA dehydrogenase